MAEKYDKYFYVTYTTCEQTAVDHWENRHFTRRFSVDTSVLLILSWLTGLGVKDANVNNIQFSKDNK